MCIIVLISMLSLHRQYSVRLSRMSPLSILVAFPPFDDMLFCVYTNYDVIKSDATGIFYL